MLNQEVYSSINQLSGSLEVDLFATRLSAQLPRFYSWKPEPLAEGVDAFLQDWLTVRGYAHPPWCLIELSEEGQGPTSSTSPDYPQLVCTTMAPSGFHDVNRLPKVSTSTGQPPSGNSQCKSPANANSAESGRVAHFRRSLTEKDFSSEVEELLSSSWRKGTHKNYDSAWRKWCINKLASPISITFSHS